MTFTCVEATNGETLFINPAQVVLIGPVRDSAGIPTVGVTGIILTTGSAFQVKGAPHDIVAVLEA